MDVVSTYKFARISARKARDVAREIQGLSVNEALNILAFTPRKSARLFQKTMRTALADAEHNFELRIDELIVKEATVGEGPTFRRFKPRARGSAAAIRKRTSHLRIVLSDDYEDGEQEEKKRYHVSPDRAQKDGKQKKTAQGKGKGKEKQKKTAKSEGETKAAESKKSKSKSKAPKGARVDDVKGVVYDAAPDDADDLTQISGVGPKLAEKLNSEGIYTFDQIANWTKEQSAAFDELLSFKGRIERDDWIKTAKKLAKEKK